MATVITNLLSAIPFIGGDIVPFILPLPLYYLPALLGGYIILVIRELYYIYIYKIFILNIIFKIYNHILFIFTYNKIKFNFNYINSNNLISNKAKIYSSEINNTPEGGYLSQEEINNINIISTPTKYIDLPKSLEILLYKFIGFIDGDGYIRITKKVKNLINKELNNNKVSSINYIYISLVINLNENELDLLNKFSSELNIGKVYNITPKKGNKLARLEINKSDIKNKLIPLLEYYNVKFLTENRQKQYLLAKYIIYNNIIKYEDLNKHKNDINNYINNNIIKYKFDELPYFKYWLVGFTMAEGSFFIKKNNDACYQLKQKYNFELFKSIKKIFNINKGISINNNKYIQLTISSKINIQKVINLFNDKDYYLLGYKCIQYNKWLLDLKSNKRYKDLNISINIE